MISDDADWVIVGQQHVDGGVVILASSTVREAHLREELHAHASMGSVDTTTKATLTVRMGDYTKVRATSYVEALRLLFADWPPDKDSWDKPFTEVVDPAAIAAVIAKRHS